MGNRGSRVNSGKMFGGITCSGDKFGRGAYSRHTFGR